MINKYEPRKREKDCTYYIFESFNSSEKYVWSIDESDGYLDLDIPDGYCDEFLNNLDSFDREHGTELFDKISPAWGC